MSQTTRIAINGVHLADGHCGLKVLVIGAGIAGLAVAIALRQQGHEVHVFEQSTSNQEFGAAVNVQPNISGLLERLGISMDSLQPARCRGMVLYDEEGTLLMHSDSKQDVGKWQNDWYFVLRITLHNALKAKAVEVTGSGAPVQIHLSQRVVDVDPHTATITLENGEAHKGDVVLGADGVHSISRKKLPGGNKDAFHSGTSAFRFLIDRQAAMADPVLSSIAKIRDKFIMWIGNDRRIVIYPAESNEILNFICIHPSSASQQATDDNSTWNNTANKETLLKLYHDFPKEAKMFLSLANPAKVKIWSLLDMDSMSVWTNDRLALLGDSCHPMLPTQGQGAAAAIEDAVCLGVLLEKNLETKEVPARLKLYEEIRHERASQIQQASRISGADRDLDAFFDLTAPNTFKFSHDEYHHSSERLRQWKWTRIPRTYWRMPRLFGPMPGPRQDHFGRKWESDHSTFTTATIKFKTSKTLLETMLPTTEDGHYKFSSPATVAYASISLNILDNLDWLGGRGYNFLSWTWHGVEYHKKSGGKIAGDFLPVMFEDLTDPILTGREELGVSKLYSDMEIERDDETLKYRVSWRGATWASIALKELKPVDINRKMHPLDAVRVPKKSNITMHHRSMPRVGRDVVGQFDSDHPVFVDWDQERVKPKVLRSWSSKSAEIEINPWDWKQLPTIHHIVQRLAEIPISEVVSATVHEGTGTAEVATATRVVP